MVQDERSNAAASRRNGSDLGAAGANGTSSRWVGENGLKISVALAAQTRFEIEAALAPIPRAIRPES